MSATDNMAKNSDALKAFTERLKTACDNCPDIPPEYQGRQAYIARKLGISGEAVSKYFSAEAMPRKTRMESLAKMLNVDRAWLELGVKPEIEFNRRNIAERVMEGSVMIVTGVLKTMGAACSIPDEKSSRNGIVHIYAIIEGRMHSIHVCQLKPKLENVFQIVVPNKYSELTCLVFAPNGAMMNILDVPTDVIDRNKVRRSNDFILTVECVDGNYMIGDDILAQFDPIGR